MDAAKMFDADIIVRLTADCPFADPEHCRLCSRTFAEFKADYLSNVVERSFPDGLDVEFSQKRRFTRSC